MNVIFLSPHFPPQFWLFCRALRNEGATVLGLGDAPHHELPHQLRETLSDYVHVHAMERYDEVLRAVGYLISRHGRIDRIDSLNEHWLELEARLREDFNIFGQRPADTARNRSKTGMREVFRGAAIPCTDGERLTSRDHAWALVERFGYPMIFKPDIGVGAAHTFKVRNDEELRQALDRPLAGYVVEKFEPTPITTFDGLTDHNGRIIYCTSLVYSAGIMDILTHRMTMHYFTRRELPPGLEAMGRKIVQAFGIRERFFHVELFELGHDTYKALEINVRPPGGFTTDMMNFASDIDVYDLWAKVLTGKNLDDWSYERKYFCAHAGRRFGVQYRYSHEQLLQKLGARIVMHLEMPPVLAGAMGEYVYFVRDPVETALKEAIADIEAPG